MTEATPRPTVVMPRAEFAALLDYSCSLPTGVVIGKRWRRKKDYYDESKGWLLGEYYALEGNDREVGIRWSELLIAEDVAAEEARAAAFVRLPRDEAQRQIDERLADLRDRIQGLPPPEQLRLAAEMLETEGLPRQMPLAVVRLVLGELERP